MPLVSKADLQHDRPPRRLLLLHLRACLLCGLSYRRNRPAHGTARAAEEDANNVLLGLPKGDSVSKYSREKLASTIRILEQELMTRIEEGILARVKRYLTDRTMRERLAERRAEVAEKDSK